MKMNKQQAEWVHARDMGHIRLGALATTAALALGALIGWSAHDNTDVRANYIAGLPTCAAEED